MIPILYEHNETVFTNNGLGRLPDCVSCTVIEERNGVFEVELVYPITGLHYADLQEGRIICVTHDEQADTQPFEIYARTAPINGLVTFYAHHISYRLSDIICQPVDGASVSAVFSEISAKSMSTNPFTFWTDNTTAGNLDIIEPRSVRAILGGQQGSILDVFGGEYKFDRFLVRNYAHRGTNNGVTIRYGKNLLDLTQDYSTLSVYNAIVPYWASMDGTVVYGGIVSQAGASEIIARAVDYSQDFPQTQPTVQQLEAKAAADLASKQPWTPSENIAIDFVALWQTEEYKYIANLERVQLCDTVTVIYTALGVQATAKVIRVEWDALNDRYSKIVLGDAKSSFAETVIKPVEQQLAQMPTTSMMQAAIDHATELITGGLGGHVVIKQNANGEPEEILIMDTADISTAVHVLRINVNGIGFSSSGVNGPYTSAWTLDGQFVADFITAGTMSANRIHGGTLVLGGQNNGNGTLQVLDASGNIIGEWDNTGADITGDLTIVKGSTTTQVANVSYTAPSGTVQTAYGLQIKHGDDEIDLIPDSTSGSTPGGTVVQAYSDTSSPPIVKMAYGGTGLLYPNKPRGYMSAEIIDSNQTGAHYLELTYNCDNYSVDGLPSTAYFRIRRNGFSYSQIGNQNPRVGLDVAPNQIYAYGQYSDSGRNPTYIFSLKYDEFKVNGKNVAFESVSSKRYKKNIKLISNKSLDPNRLLDLPVKQYRYNDGLPLQYADMAGQTLPGFIAEDVAEIYPAAAIHNADGEVESWDERRIVPGMLALIQAQQKRIDDLEARLARLEALING